MSDPETKKEMESLNINKMTSEMPEFSEMLTKFFTGSGPSTARKDDTATKQKITAKPNKKRN